MPKEPVANAFSEIAARLKEIEKEKQQSDPEVIVAEIEEYPDAA
jgi:hypothetical protein